MVTARGSRMLSEDLQDGIGCNEATQTGVPHGPEVFASGFVEFNGKRVVIFPRGLAVGCQTGSQCLGIGLATGLNEKRQRPHDQHQGAFTLLLRGLDGWPILARSSWPLPER